MTDIFETCMQTPFEPNTQAVIFKHDRLILPGRKKQSVNNNWTEGTRQQTNKMPPSSMLIILLLSALSGAGFADGVRCMECQDIPHPAVCSTVTKCPDGDLCYVEQYITTGGLVLYTSGCMSTMRCGSGKRSFYGIPKVRKRADVVTCDECCNGEFCNLEGCGQKAIQPPDRGPVCFSCPSQAGQDMCRTIELCDIGELCQLETIQGFSSLWKSGCRTKTECNQTGQNSSSATSCSCCADNFCNDHCQVMSTPSPGGTVSNVATVTMASATPPQPNTPPTATTTQPTIQAISQSESTTKQVNTTAKLTTISSTSAKPTYTHTTVQDTSIISTTTLSSTKVITTPDQTTHTTPKPIITTHTTQPSTTTGSQTSHHTTKVLTSTLTSGVSTSTYTTEVTTSTHTTPAPITKHTTQMLTATNTTQASTTVPKHTAAHSTTVNQHGTSTHTATTHSSVQTTSGYLNVGSSACPFKPADIIFVLDGSGSEGLENFRKQLAFAANFTKQFEIGGNNTRVALVTYATTVANQFYLNQYLTKDDVLRHINLTRYPDGETNTHLALRFVETQTLSAAHDGRNATKVVIVLTDGRSLEPDLTKAAAQSLKNNPLVEVLAIGIGRNIDPQELHAIASDKNHTFLIPSFDALHTIQAELTRETCNACKYDVSDICFVLDASGSEGSQNFMKQLEFVNQVVNEFEVDGSHGTQVCVITFGTNGHTEIRLDSFRTKAELMENVLKIPYRDGETQTDLGLRFADKELFAYTFPGYMHQHSGARQGANKVAIVLTDGRSTSPILTENVAKLLQRKGTDIFAIGIGQNIDQNELRAIASDRDHVLTVHSFNELDSIHQLVVKNICAKNVFTTTVSTTTASATPVTSLSASTTFIGSPYPTGSTTSMHYTHHTHHTHHPTLAHGGKRRLELTTPSHDTRD